jgi:hypothetical protein
VRLLSALAAASALAASAPSARADDEQPASVVASVAAGAALHRLIDIPAYGAEGVATLGGKVVAAEVTFAGGRTQYGLHYWQLTGGPLVRGRIGAFTFGGSIYLSLFQISPPSPDIVTENGTPIVGPSLVGGNLGTAAEVGYDVVRWPRSALFVLARAVGEVGSMPLLGAGLACGYRFGP